MAPSYGALYPALCTHCSSVLTQVAPCERHVAPMAFRYQPPTQCVQLPGVTYPSPAHNSPAGHMLQLPAAHYPVPVLYVPAAHAQQVAEFLAPRAGEYVPCQHATHAALARLAPAAAA